MSRKSEYEPTTREGKIAKAFVASFPQLTPLIGKHPPAVMRKKAWQIIRKRVSGVTQAVVTRTLLKFAEVVQLDMVLREGKRPRA